MRKQLRFDEQPYGQDSQFSISIAFAGQKVNIVYDCNDNNNYTYSNNKQLYRRCRGWEGIYLFISNVLAKQTRDASVCMRVCVCVLLSQCQVQSARKKASIDLTQFLAKFRYPSSPSSLYANTYVRRINSRVFLTYISLEEKCISRKLKSNRKQLHKFKEMERV